MSKETEIKDKVFEKIRSGEASMRPKIYFTLRLILLGTASVLALLLAIFVLSFVFFSIHESGEQFLLGFGQHGFQAFIALFPWWSLLLTVLLILLMDYLLRYFKFGYRVSILEIFLIALVVVMIAGVSVDFTPLHSALLNSADHDDLPIIGHLYEQIHDPHEQQGVYRGTIISIQGDEFIITHNDNDKDSDDGTWTIVVPLGFSTSTLQIGESMYVAGKLTEGKVEAYGVHELTPDRE
jgi:hypothetical protein